MRFTWFMIVAVAVLATLGCGSGKKRLDTVPISGIVTLDGTPVEGAKVVYNPTSANERPASGVTDSSGRYKLTTQDPGDGALAGTYLVMISKTETESPTSQAIKPGMTDEEATKAAMEAYVKGGKAQPKSTEFLPAKYKNPATSGFKVEVAKGGKTEHDFPLTSK